MNIIGIILCHRLLRNSIVGQSLTYQWLSYHGGGGLAHLECALPDHRSLTHPCPSPLPSPFLPPPTQLR